ncbi:hypothetical protein Btru_049962 [Bulinus truncatus]|nr:hypothetical protein Btru_049962 [Bulinus truncatus]
MKITCVNAFLMSIFYCPLVTVSKSAIQTCAIIHNSNLDNKTSTSWIFKENVVVSNLDCATQCLTNPSCVTYMVNRNTKICRLYSTRISQYNALMASSGYTSYDTCRGCVKYGSMFTVIRKSYISGNDLITLTTSQYLTPGGCGQACVSTTSFTCLSFELDQFYGRCYLQSVTPFLNRLMISAIVY